MRERRACRPRSRSRSPSTWAIETLTPAEVAVLRLIAAGNANKEIAAPAPRHGGHRQGAGQEHPREARRQRPHARGDHRPQEGNHPALRTRLLRAGAAYPFGSDAASTHATFAAFALSVTDRSATPPSRRRCHPDARRLSRSSGGTSACQPPPRLHSPPDGTPLGGAQAGPAASGRWNREES